MSSTEAVLLVCLIFAIILLCAMAAECFQINNEWYEIAKNQNEEWFELFLRQNKEWTEECHKLQTKVSELEGREKE